MGQSLNQLVVFKGLRQQVMFVNHESAFSGHLGAKKTEVGILTNFFWLGQHQDVIRFEMFGYTDSRKYVCNRLVERWNRILKSMLRGFVKTSQSSGRRLINPVQFAYREIPQESTGFSPFQLLYRRLVRRSWNYPRRVMDQRSEHS